MTARQVIEIRCDVDGCKAKHRPPKGFCQLSEWAARGSAGDAGWQTRPLRGRGSRSAPDLCPDCAARAAREVAATIDRFMDR